MDGFTGFYRVLPGFTGFSLDGFSVSGALSVLFPSVGEDGLWMVLPGFTRFYRVLLGFIRFY